MGSDQTRFNILMFPWLAHGHIYPYLQLAKNLSNRNFNIFICSTQVNLTSIATALETNSNGHSIHLLQLDMPSSPELPPELHTTKNLPHHLMPKLIEAFNMTRSSFSTIITSLHPDVLIYDAFQPWAAATAASLGIPAVHFATTGAAAYSFYYHNFLNKILPFPYDALYLRGHEWKAALQIMALRDQDHRDRTSQDDGFSHFTLSSDVILMKTSRGIEGKYVDYLSVSCGKKVVAVGPLITPAAFDENHSEIMQWLSSKKPSSTVLISFGSENYLSEDQIGEIAKGLETSNVNFIWVVRFPADKKVTAKDTLPEGFLDRTGERGLIVEGWAPQTAILAHPSVGGFMSHCGMSSTIESMYFGVPIIAIPLKLDQPLNARVVVEAGAAVEVERDEDGCLSSGGIASAINEVFVERTGEEMRIKAAELSKKMKSEEENEMNEAAEQLWRICMKHKQQK